MDMDQTYTTAEAAEALGLSLRRVQQLVRAGSLPAQKRGGVWFVARADLESFRDRDRAPGRPAGGAPHERTETYRFTARMQGDGGGKHLVMTLTGLSSGQVEVVSEIARQHGPSGRIRGYQETARRTVSGWNAAHQAVRNKRKSRGWKQSGPAKITCKEVPHG